MNHNEIEESGKDLEIEITDLDEVDASGGSPRPPRLFMEPRFISRKYRKPVTIATTAFIVLAMLLLLLSTSPLKLLFTQTLPSTFSLKRWKGCRYSLMRAMSRCDHYKSASSIYLTD